jgi:septal ring factor EnvC (AmiA/AmiB activator)
MTVASSADFNLDQDTTAEAARAGRGDVSITITGWLAEKVIGHGETEARAREALARELRQRLDAIEAAVSQRASEHERLEQLIHDLRGQVAQLNGQAADQITQLRTEVGRMRSGFAEAGDRFRDLHARLDRLERGVENLGSPVENLQGTIERLQDTVGGLEGKLGGLEQTVERLPPKRPRPLLLAWRKSLHFWATIVAVATLATAGALWLNA